MATFKIKRGLEADIPQLDEGELGLSTDSGKLFAGTDSGNHSFPNSDTIEKALQLLKEDILNETSNIVDSSAKELVQNAVNEGFKTFDAQKVNQSDLNTLVPRIYQEIIARVDQSMQMCEATYATKTDVNQSISKLNDNMDSFQLKINKNLSSSLDKTNKDLTTKLKEINDTIDKGKIATRDYIENRLTEKANLKHRHKASDIDGLTSSSLPDQTGNNGKFLTTNGTAASWGTPAGTGDMTKAVYDAANIGEQLVGLTATQTLTNKQTTGLKMDGIKNLSNLKTLEITDNAAAVNYLVMRAGSTGQSVTLGAQSVTDTDVYLNLTSQNAGTVRANNVQVADISTAQVLTNKDLTSGTNTFPTLNQNTTGSAAKWTTARNLAGNSVDGSANVAFANKFIVQGTTDTGLSAAQFLGALGTGIVKNTTTTGILSIAVAGDFPILNQNTTGTANIAGGTAGAIPYQSGAGATTVLAATATANKILLSGASAAPTWSVPTFPNASATSGKLIVSDGTNWIASTPTYPNASATTRKIIVSDGTNFIASTETYAVPGTSGNVLTSDGTNWTSAAPIVTTSNTATFTNKRITKRTGTTTSSATPTINTDNVDFYSLTAQTVDITSMTTNLSGTPTEGQTLWIAITGTAARAITWGTSFEASTVALPTTTVTTNRLDVGFIWNTVTNKWRCVATC